MAEQRLVIKEPGGETGIVFEQIGDGWIRIKATYVSYGTGVNPNYKISYIKEMDLVNFLLGNKKCQTLSLT